MYLDEQKEKVAKKQIRNDFFTALSKIKDKGEILSCTEGLCKHYTDMLKHNSSAPSPTNIFELCMDTFSSQLPDTNIPLKIYISTINTPTSIENDLKKLRTLVFGQEPSDEKFAIFLEALKAEDLINLEETEQKFLKGQKNKGNLKRILKEFGLGIIAVLNNTTMENIKLCDTIWKEIKDKKI
jgi:hypothetical protein